MWVTWHPLFSHKMRSVTIFSSVVGYLQSVLSSKSPPLFIAKVLLISSIDSIPMQPSSLGRHIFLQALQWDFLLSAEVPLKEPSQIFFNQVKGALRRAHSLESVNTKALEDTFNYDHSATTSSNLPFYPFNLLATFVTIGSKWEFFPAHIQGAAKIVKGKFFCHETSSSSHSFNSLCSRFTICEKETFVFVNLLPRSSFIVANLLHNQSHWLVIVRTKYHNIICHYKKSAIYMGILLGIIM